MKNFKYLLLILIISSCKKILHEPDYNISQINSTDEMNIAVNGLYARLAFYINWYDEPPQYFADDFGYFGVKYSELGMLQQLTDGQIFIVLLYRPTILFASFKTTRI